MSKKKKRVSSVNKKKYALFFAVGVLLVLLVLSLSPSLIGYSIYDAVPSLQGIAVEDGATADDIVAISSFARSQGIRETILTSEMTGSEVNYIIFQTLGGDTATISLSGSNIVIEGDVEQAVEVLVARDSYVDLLSQYDSVNVVNGQVVVEETEETTTPQNNCVDSDGGDNPDVYGTLTGTDAYGNVIDQPDQCGSGTATVNDVFEKVCTETSYTYTQHTCSNGCSGGACIQGEEVVSPVCGDGVVDAIEGCDDGNTLDGDGCTSTCVVEVARECYETESGVSGNSYGYDYSYNNYCYYYDYYGAYYYADYYCAQSTYDNRWYATSTWNQCPSGCEDAEGCVDVETVEASCTDSDSGADQNTFGTTESVNKFGEEKTIEDSCYSYYEDYQYVIEGYCSGTNVYTQYILCDGVCQDGVCVAGQEAVCEDSDNTDIYSPQESSGVLGEVTGTDRSGNTYTKVDECYDSYGYEYVKEQYCNERNAPTTTWTYCQGGCEGGVCVEPTWEQSCTDSDETETNAGKDLYTAGSASGIDYYGREFTYADYCYYNSWDQTYYVVDYYCAESSYSGPYASSYYEKCPSGCTAGACDAAETTVTPSCTATETGVSGTDQYGNGYAYWNTCGNMETLIEYSCSTEAGEVPYVVTETSCNCVEGLCVAGSMTVAEFVSNLPSGTMIVIGESAATEDNIAAIDLAGAYDLDVVTDATSNDFSSANIIAIGGPYANAASRQALGGNVWDYQPGQALFFLQEYDAGGTTLIVSGSEAQDTRNAVKKLIDFPSSLDFDYGVEQVS